MREMFYNNMFEYGKALYSECALLVKMPFAGGGSIGVGTPCLVYLKAGSKSRKGHICILFSPPVSFPAIEQIGGTSPQSASVAVIVPFHAAYAHSSPNTSGVSHWTNP